LAESVEEIESLTDAAAAAPKSVTVDGQTVQEHSIPDLIALENHRANKEATTGGRLGVGFFNTRPPGAV
jgi:hypothetical protein